MTSNDYNDQLRSPHPQAASPTPKATRTLRHQVQGHRDQLQPLRSHSERHQPNCDLQNESITTHPSRQRRPTAGDLSQHSR